MPAGQQRKKISGILILMLLLTTTVAGARDDLFTVTIIPIRGEPVRVEDFSQKGVYRYRVFRKNKKIHFDFKDLHTIEFTEPGSKGYPVLITFRNGTIGEYKLFPHGNMEGKTKSGPWQMSHRRIKAIKFVDDGEVIEPAVSIDPDKDRVVLVGDGNLSGRVLTEELTLRTFYGVLNLPTGKIRRISFHGGGDNPDVVILRTGDRLSGHVETESFKIMTDTEKEEVLQKENIKSVLFRE